MRTPLRTLLPASLCAAGLLLAHAPTASAQGALTNALVNDANPTDAELDQIREIARLLCERLASTDDPREMERTRRELLRPFTGFSSQSVAFRLAWGRMVADRLADVATDDDVRRAVNALAALGPTGMEETIEILASALADERASIRLAAASAMGDAIQGDTSVATLREPCLMALEAAAEALKNETDPAVAAALVSSMSVPQSRTVLVPRASELLAEVIPDVVRALPQGFDRLSWGKAMARAGVTIRAGAINATPNQAGGATVLRQSTFAMTASLAMARRIVNEHEDPGAIAGTPLETVLEELVATASSQVALSAQRMGVNTPVPDLTSALERALETGDPAQLADAIDALRPALDEMRVGTQALDD